MKHKHFLIMVFFIVIFILSVQNVWAQVPQTMSYQGVLMKAKGTLVQNGQYTLTFKLYDAAEGGKVLWSETQTIRVEDGLFNAALGRLNSLDIPFDQPYWLAVTIGDGEEVSRRMQLTSSAYSLHARSVADNAITKSKIAEGQVVKSINSITDDVTFAAGENVRITQEGNLLIISANLDQLSIEDSEELAAAADLDKLSTGDSKDKLTVKPPDKDKVINSKAGVEIVIDKDDDSTSDIFSVRKDGKSKDAEGTELFRVQEDGNVGIGTSSPAEKLSVAGIIESTSGGFKFPDGTIQTTAGADGSSLNSPDGSQTDVLVVDNTGNIGIGTATPTVKLEVDGSFHARGQIKAGNTITLSGDNPSDPDSITTSSNSLVLGGDPGFSDIKVGIGTPGPTGSLHVKDGAVDLMTVGNYTINNLETSPVTVRHTSRLFPRALGTGVSESAALYMRIDPVGFQQPALGYLWRNY